MADQRLVGIDRIVAALGKINTSIQKTKTYKDGNIYSLDSDGMVELSGASALMAFLGVTTFVPGTTDGTSGADGDLDVLTELGSSVTEISGASVSLGDLDVETELGSSIAEISGAGGTLGDLDVETKLRGTIAGGSIVSGYLDAVYIAGKSESSSDEAAALDSQPGLAAVCISATSAIDENDELYL